MTDTITKNVTRNPTLDNPAFETEGEPTRTWGGREYPLDRWEDGFSECLCIEADIRATKDLPPVLVGGNQYSLREYPPEFLNWLEENSPLEGVDEFAAYLSEQSVDPALACISGHLLNITSDGHLQA